MASVSNGSWKASLRGGNLSVPEETESGSAGKQLDKGYSGRRCAKGAAEPQEAMLSGAISCTALDTGVTP